MKLSGPQPGRFSVQAAELGFACLPGGQAVHAGAPGAEYFPISQMTHQLYPRQAWFWPKLQKSHGCVRAQKSAKYWCYLQGSRHISLL
jgi:hypothetical protein